MDNTRLPDDLYDSEGCGGGNAASSTTDTASLTALVQRMLLRLDELDSRTSSIQQPPPQKPIPATPADGLEVFTAAAHAALTATLRANNATARDTADANDLLDSAIRTIATCGQAAEDRLTYLRRFKCKKALTGEERVAERLVYSRFFDTTAAERSGNGVDGLLNALDDKRLEVSLHQAAAAQAAAQFKGSCSGGSGGGSGNIRIKEQERASEHADRATKERADKNKDKNKIKGKPQPGNPARKTTTPQTEEQN
eukprot:jgi/Tetstr1/442723/TSEL_030813.t1